MLVSGNKKIIWWCAKSVTTPLSLRDMPWSRTLERRKTRDIGKIIQLKLSKKKKKDNIILGLLEWNHKSLNNAQNIFLPTIWFHKYCPGEPPRLPFSFSTKIFGEDESRWLKRGESLKSIYKWYHSSLDPLK